MKLAHNTHTYSGQTGEQEKLGKHIEEPRVTALAVTPWSQLCSSVSLPTGVDQTGAHPLTSSAHVCGGLIHSLCTCTPTLEP